MQEWQNDVGSVLAYVDKDGKIVAPSFQAANLQITTQPAKDRVLTSLDDFGNAVWKLSPGSPWTLVRDEKPQSINGGDFVAGAWQKRTLNFITGRIPGLTLSNSQLTFTTLGLYRCHIICPAYNVDRHKARLQNVTTNATAVEGTAMFSGNTQFSHIVGLFGVVSAPTTFEIQHQCARTQLVNGFGVGSNFSTEIYTVAEFWLEQTVP